MAPYVRPELPDTVYVGDDGTPIPYGNRWDGMEVPEEAYSRTTHLERYAPLHSVAELLIDWLTEDYDVTVLEDPVVAHDVAFALEAAEGESKPTIRAVRLTPSDPAAAPLSFVFTDFPGVIVHAGALADHVFPSCGCDACDEDVAWVVEDLEWTVNAVVGGGFAEQIGSLSSDRVGSSLVWGDRSTSGNGARGDLSKRRREAAQRMLPPSGAWSAWPLRA